jgi:hypothetical protein
MENVDLWMVLFVIVGAVLLLLITKKFLAPTKTVRCEVLKKDRRHIPEEKRRHPNNLIQRRRLIVIDNSIVIIGRTDIGSGNHDDRISACHAWTRRRLYLQH